LQELVSAGYLREVPKDPICPDCTWNEIAAQGDPGDLNSSGGIGDVKSAAPGEDSNGKPYSEY
jgi:general secretion pathway protein G